MKFKTFRNVVGAALGVALLSGAVMLCRAIDGPGGASRAHPSPGPSAEQSAPGPRQPLRPIDRQILSRVEQNIPGEKVKDAFSGARFKVNLYRDTGSAYVNRVKVDFDRDDHWDEHWSIDRSTGTQTIHRQVSSTDDDNYDVSYDLQGDVWVRR